MTTIAYRSAAELFSVGSWRSKGRAVRYRRFAIAAEAIRFAIEELGREHLAGVYLEVDEERFDSAGIRRLIEMVTIDPLELRAALDQDAAA